MKKLVFCTLLCFIALAGIGSSTFAQNALPSLITNENLSGSMPAAPMPAMAPLTNATGHGYWGFDLGLTYSFYSGASNFFWPVNDAINNISTPLQFDNLGSGIGGIFGFKAGFPLSNSIDLEGKLRYLTNYTSATESHDLFVTNTQSSGPATNNYTLLLSNLDLAAMLHFALSNQWYAAGGLSFSGLLSNNFSAVQTLGTGLVYNDNNGNPTGVTRETVPSGSQSGLFNSSRVDLQIGAGSVFPISSFALDAELLVSVPLTTWLQSSKQANYNAFADAYNAEVESAGSNPILSHPSIPNLWYAYLTIGIRFQFGGNAGASAAEQQEATEPSSTPAIGSDGKVALTGTVTDAKTGDPVDADLTVVDLTNNQVVATDHTDGKGRYNVRVKAPGKYSVTADGKDHLFGTSYFEVDPQCRILSRHPDIKLSPASGRTRLLVFFDFGKSSLTPSSYPELGRAVRLMKAVPSMQVEIAGYTDNIGSDDVNMRISQQRANAVRDYILQQGIDASRVTAKGYGKDSPIADNSTDEGRAENRRVEFVVLSK